MSRLYDRMRRYGINRRGDDIDGIFARDEGRMFAGVPVIKCDNVCEYFYAKSSKETWSYGKDIPNLSPPFEWCFLESRAPSTVLMGEDHLSWPEDAPNEWGMFLQADDYKKEASKQGIDDWETASMDSLAYTLPRMRDASPVEDFMLGEPVEPARWFLHANVYLRWHHKTASGPVLMIFLAVKEDGTLAKTSEGQQIMWGMPSPWAVAPENRNSALAFLSEEVGTLIQPLFLAVSFMHCKNVRLAPQDPPAALSKKFRKRTGVDLTRYYTLNIEPMKEVLETQGNVTKLGLKRALHIARGHFATYSPDKPLFGKYSGTFWKPQHVRGSKKHGEVVKDYSVKAPVGPA